MWFTTCGNITWYTTLMDTWIDHDHRAISWKVNRQIRVTLSNERRISYFITQEQIVTGSWDLMRVWQCITIVILCTIQVHFTYLLSYLLTYLILNVQPLSKFKRLKSQGYIMYQQHERNNRITNAPINCKLGGNCNSEAKCFDTLSFDTLSESWKQTDEKIEKWHGLSAYRMIR